MKAQFEVDAPVEVTYILRELIRTRELLTASFNQGRDSMATLLLDADRDRNIVVFDGSSDAAINRSIVAASHVGFTGSLRGARIEFFSVGAKEMAYRGAPALAVRFPAVVKRFQNREAFRVKTITASCTLPVPGRGYITVPVQEMSVGGSLLMVDSAADSFHLGQTLDCQFKLGGQGALRCRVEVRGFKRVGRAMGMGCRFVSLSRSDEAAIARFVAQEERDSITKGGFRL
ncbi:MAG TPA: flagellar brake protein [Rhodocyclaceae bacterium]